MGCWGKGAEWPARVASLTHLVDAEMSHTQQLAGVSVLRKQQEENTKITALAFTIFVNVPLAKENHVAN